MFPLCLFFPAQRILKLSVRIGYYRRFPLWNRPCFTVILFSQLLQIELILWSTAWWRYSISCNIAIYWCQAHPFKSILFEIARMSLRKAIVHRGISITRCNCPLRWYLAGAHSPCTNESYKLSWPPDNDQQPALRYTNSDSDLCPSLPFTTQTWLGIHNVLNSSNAISIIIIRPANTRS